MNYEDAVKRQRCIEIVKQLKGQTLDEARKILEDLLAIAKYDVGED